MLESIAVVLGSYVLSVVLVLCMDPLLLRIFPGDFVRGRVPSDKPLIASTAFLVVISIFYAWGGARFAPGRAGWHVLWFFIVAEVMGIVSMIPNWNQGWPHWYWLSWLITWPVACWIGLTIAGRRANQAAA